ncbi:MAG: hypothetical protein AAF514_04435, partial [Verrucomicrobiota bacterium]
MRLLICWLAGTVVFGACTRREQSEEDQARNALELWLKSQSLPDVVETSSWSEGSAAAAPWALSFANSSVMVDDGKANSKPSSSLPQSS